MDFERWEPVQNALKRSFDDRPPKWLISFRPEYRRFLDGGWSEVERCCQSFCYTSRMAFS